jgi:hypothetical protein
MELGGVLDFGYFPEKVKHTVQGTSVNNRVVISLNSTKVWATARVAGDWKLVHGEISGFLFRGLQMHARNRKQESK